MPGTASSKPIILPLKAMGNFPKKDKEDLNKFRESN
jgi:hypothetical protein